ncbi:hypothetical protein QTP88_007486 [Uroleucon formosanum]
MSKQAQITNFFKQPPNTSTPTNQNSNKRNLDTTDENNEPPLKKVKIFKYNNSYIEYGFTSLNDNGTDVPQCVICSMTLANASLKPTLNNYPARCDCLIGTWLRCNDIGLTKVPRNISSNLKRIEVITKKNYFIILLDLLKNYVSDN